MEIPIGEDNNNSLELNISARNELIESRLARLEEDRKTFEFLVAIVKDNVRSDGFYNEYVKLTQTLVKETKALSNSELGTLCARFSVKLKNFVSNLINTVT